MPTVPTYNGPQVREQAAQPIFQQNVDTTQGLRSAAAGLGAVADVTNRIDLRDAQAKAYAAESAVTTEWLKWDQQARAQYRGEKVDGYAPAAEEWWKKAAEVFGKDLDPRAKALASRGLVSKQTSALGSVLQFSTAEKERHTDEVANANIASTIQFGVTTGDVASAAQQVRELTAQIGARKGWTTEQVQAAQTQQLGQLHAAQIGKLAEVDPVAAQAYYDDAKSRNEIPFAAQTRIEGVLKAEVDNQFATTFAAQNAALPLDQQLAKAGEITDPERKKKTILEIKNNNSLIKEAQRAQEEQFADQAWQLVGQGKRVPEAVLAAMDGKERVQLQEHLRAKAERGAAPVKTNPVALARVYDMMRDDPEGFKKLRMEALTTTFSSTDIEQVARIQREALKPDSTKDVATTAQLLGTYTGGWKAEKRGVFEAAAYDELARAAKEKGRPPSYDEKRKILDRLMIDGEVMSGAWYKADPDKKFFEATPEERARFAPVITSDDRKLIVQALQAEGIAQPTDAQIQQRFKLAKGIQ